MLSLGIRKATTPGFMDEGRGEAGVQYLIRRLKREKCTCKGRMCVPGNESMDVYSKDCV